MGLAYLQLRLSHLLVADIANDRSEDSPARQLQFSYLQFEWKGLPTPALRPDLDCLAENSLFTGPHIAQQMKVMFLADVFGHEHAYVATDDLRCCVVEDLLSPGIEGLDDSALVDTDDAVVDILGPRTKVQYRFAQILELFATLLFPSLEFDLLLTQALHLCIHAFLRAEKFFLQLSILIRCQHALPCEDCATNASPCHQRVGAGF